MIGSSPIGSSPLGSAGGSASKGSELTAPVATLTATGFLTPSSGNFTLTAPTGRIKAGKIDMTALIAPVGTLRAGTGVSMALAAPAPTLTAYFGAVAAGVAPAPTLSFLARNNYGENAVIQTAPAPKLTSYVGANAALRATRPTILLTATGTALATALLAAPAARLASSGTVSVMANASLKAPAPNLVGYGGAVCIVTTSAGTITATGTTGGVGSMQVTVPMAQLLAEGTAQSYGSAILVAPAGRMAATLQAYLIAPGATLTAIGTATITASYEAYALNLNHSDTGAVDELTRYTNFPFTHVVRYKNSYYGANSTGLYLLEGTTDAGAPIAWQFKTGISDLGKPNLKTVTYAYFGGRLGPAATVSIYPGESTGESYSYNTPRGQAAQNYRQPFGRGLKARYFAIGASGAGEMKLDSLDLLTETLTRRI